MRLNIARIGAFALILMTAALYQAQADQPTVVKVAASAPKTVASGKPFLLMVTISIDKPYHIQANPPKENYVATVVQVGDVPGIRVGKITYPKATQATIAGDTIPVYEGTASVKVQVTASKAGKYKLPITVRYQACNDKSCYPPATVKAEATVTVAGT